MFSVSLYSDLLLVRGMCCRVSGLTASGPGVGQGVQQTRQQAASPSRMLNSSQAQVCTSLVDLVQVFRLIRGVMYMRCTCSGGCGSW